LELVQEKVKAIVCLGKDNKKIVEAFKGVVPEIYETQSAMEAVAYGYRLAKKDETVLLSPACASFDLFENYEERGNEFKKAVRAL
jgi:UDP-N-acetylmuramoylalanine--D-glutamate ligase